MNMTDVSIEAMDQIADYFQTLGEPTRLRLLHAMRKGECSVGELTKISGRSQANVSRHLTLLAKSGLVGRRHAGTTVYYSICNPSIFMICDLACVQIAERLGDIVELRRQMKAEIRTDGA